MQNAVGQVSGLIWLNNQTTQNNRTTSANYIHQIAHLERVLFDDAWTALSIEHWLSFTGHLAAVRLSPDGQLIGYALISQVFDSADLLRVGVAPDCQRQGIAQQLLTTMTAQLKQQSVERLLLEVRKDNTAARALYGKLGFQQIHIRKNYYKNTDGSRCDALILQLDLTTCR
ncbi:ribosomal protein S18-alanine N-acetyltransferase [Moraxella atlantae]|uniref:ribosomal protein S18-alanine N-acetyltransferase n=1 Tax=Faucicola atlantae TaxID=34059 RepID=UPI003752FA2F